VNRNDLIAEAWRRGNLSYLLHDGQAGVREEWRSSDARRWVLCCSRRYGKSFWLCVEAVELALRRERMQIRYAAPTQKMVRSIVEPHMREVLWDCPDDLKPAFSRQEGVWRFPNGSEIHAAGCDGGSAERLRGTSTDLALVDEAGFIADLDYVVDDILMPQTLTTDGRILVVSTPARSPAHPFANYCAAAEAKGAYAHRTIYDAPHIPEHAIVEYMEEAGGEGSSTWRREYLAETVVDEDAAVVPEYTMRAVDIVVDDWKRPEYFKTYTVADLGFSDLTVWLFAYHDFDNDLIVVEDELVFRNTHAGAMTQPVLEVEERLWGEVHGDRHPMRIADAQPLVLAEMAQGGLTVAPARNDDPTAAVNNLRRQIQGARWRIFERCRTLRSHLRAAVWDSRRRHFARMDGVGHFDALAAAMYLERHVERRASPYPALARGVSSQTHHIRPHAIPISGLSKLARGRRR
jgi:hypothetical protein